MMTKKFLTTLQILHMARGCGVAIYRKSPTLPSPVEQCGDRHGDRLAYPDKLLPANDVVVTVVPLGFYVSTYRSFNSLVWANGTVNGAPVMQPHQKFTYIQVCLFVFA